MTPLRTIDDDVHALTMQPMIFRVVFHATAAQRALVCLGLAHAHPTAQRNDNRTS